jgi:peroxiredoxin
LRQFKSECAVCRKPLSTLLPSGTPAAGQPKLIHNDHQCCSYAALGYALPQQLDRRHFASYVTFVTFHIAPGFRGAPSLCAVALACLQLLAVACVFSDRASAAPVTFQPWQGDSQPTFVLRNVQGSSIPLSSHESPIVLVHFFATWCAACKEELPALQRLADRAGAEIQIFAISVDDPEPRLRRFLEKIPLNFPALLDPGRATTKAWNVTSLPTTFVLDQNLKTRLFIESAFPWDEIEPAQLEKLLATGALEPTASDVPHIK